MKQWRAWFCLSISGLGGCSPGLDWREVRLDDAQVIALFPCKPEVLVRPAMGLAQCQAKGLSFALSWAQLDEPVQVAPALQQMRESLAGKLAASPVAPQAVQVPGMTPNPQALSQRLPGAAQQARVAVFSHGLRVYQATMLGTKADDTAWGVFLDSLKIAAQ